MTLAQHSAASVEWYTPKLILDKVRAVLGSIELDPFSSAEANKLVQAERFFTPKEDGFRSVWHAKTVYCNPPGGKIKNKSMAALAWHRLHNAWVRGEVGSAIFMGFSLNILQTAQDDDILNFPFCIPRSRIRFVGESSQSFSPTHPNVLIYLPKWRARRGAASSWAADFCRFNNEFHDLGVCRANE